MKLLQIAALASLPLALSATAAASAQSTDVPDQQEDRTAQEDVQKVQWADLNFADAISRAERLDKLLVIVWHDERGRPDSKALQSAFDDTGVVQWIRDHAIAVRIDADAHPKDARRNSVGTEGLPVIDLYDARLGARVERFPRTMTAIDFLATVFGIGSAEVDIERPVVGEEAEPFRWLAWANRRFRSQDVDAATDAVFGYAWCLQFADDARPGFRARYFEFLLRRIAECKARAVASVSVLSQERELIANRMRQGVASRRDVYELTRIDFWWRKELVTRDLFLELHRKGPAQDQCRKWLFPEVVEILGRYQQYDQILELVAHDPAAMFRKRIAELARFGAKDDEKPKPTEASEVPPGPPDPPREDPDAPMKSDEEPLEPPLEYAILDSRAEIIEDASWVFEALLASGRGADAKAIKELILETYPVTRSFGLFFERCLRLELYGLAAEIADTGMGVLDAKGQKRMQRLLGKIPSDPGKKSPDAGGGTVK